MKARIVTFMLVALAAASAATAESLTRGGNLSVDAADDGRLLIDLAGGLWVVPHGGGEAKSLAQELRSVRRPRWSPDGTRIVYTASDGDAQRLWLHDVANGHAQRIGGNGGLDLDPEWHPGGERIVFAADRRGSGLDLWEIDLATGLQWRLSSHAGDETEPAWSADGRDLVYVHHDGGTWSLVLRRHGQPEERLVTRDTRISGPSWRPDGSLIVYWQDDGTEVALNMVILSTPRLIRRFAGGEDFVTTPVSWLDRHRMFYAAGGAIRQRLFNSWSSRTVPFRATIASQPAAVVERVRRRLPENDVPTGTLIVHATRLFDGLAGAYHADRDIVIEGGRIAAVEDHRDRPGAIVIDMGDLVVMPGLTDVHTRLPAGTDVTTGPLLLAAGVTTLVAEHDEAEHLDAVWSGKELPGPRLLPASDWVAGPGSELADSQTPGLAAILESRAAEHIGFDDVVARRFSEPPTIEAGRTSVVLGSRGNGLPAGIALHAELRALVAAGLRPEQALRAAGVNAAAALGVDPNLGRIATGAVADLVFVDGDPLRRIDDALNVVAIVRNGRFFSVAGLIERAEAARNVE